MAALDTADETRTALARQAVGALGLASAVAGGAAIDAIQIPELDTLGVLVTMLPSGLLGAAAVSLALSRKTRAGAAFTTIAACVLAGLLNSPISFLLTQLVGRGNDMGNVPGLFGGVILAALFGAIFSAPLGFLFGLAFVAPVAYVHRLRERVSIDARDRAGIALALVTLAIAAFTWVVTTGIFHVNPATHVAPELATPEALPLALAALAGLALLFFAVRLSLRRAWIARVRAGRVRGWEIVPARDVDTAGAELLPLTPFRAEHAAVLVEIAPSREGGAYRELDHRLPRALVAAG